jgi:hypothetical protein
MLLLPAPERASERIATVRGVLEQLVSGSPAVHER